MKMRLLQSTEATSLVCILSALFAAAVLPVSSQDWPMWGGTPQRNMVSGQTGLPVSWDIKSGRSIKWKATLGSTSYGNPVVSGGKIFAGTNNDNPRNPAVEGDKGILMCFREADGKFLWQAVSDKLETGAANDWPSQGICSSPLVDADRLYYVTNRGELVCLDVEGFLDGENDGPFDAEKLKSTIDADIVWSLDMMKELGVRQHNMANSSPAMHGDLVFVETSNGIDEDHARVPAPQAPSFIAVNKKTGKLVWKDNSPGDKIMNGQWSSPALGMVNGTMQAFFPGGDGWLYGFDALTGAPLWKFDLNPKAAVSPKSRNDGIATPVFHQDRIFMGTGQDPEQGEGMGHMYCIDPSGKGDITETGQVWHYEKIRRTISTAAVAGGLVYIADFSGFLHCLDAQTGKPFWVHDMLAAVWGSPLVADGRVYLGDEDGDVAVLQAGKELKVLAENSMGSSVYSTPVPANGVLFIMNRGELYALGNGPVTGN